ncbi:hypothetical protein QFC21_001821 [Naganishia friedmannii]|uniref:Uncharacterized protein n=1 Tax=Naganishia friedmannii TaxID=89922 RepID=A0ACC2W2W4_9TREE|nr:hypothetical protein QFC21_001821 [Naganishia friedmannii]
MLLANRLSPSSPPLSNVNHRTSPGIRTENLRQVGQNSKENATMLPSLNIDLDLAGPSAGPSRLNAYTSPSSSFRRSGVRRRSETETSLGGSIDRLQYQSPAVGTRSHAGLPGVTSPSFDKAGNLRHQSMPGPLNIMVQPPFAAASSPSTSVKQNKLSRRISSPNMQANKFLVEGSPSTPPTDSRYIKAKSDASVHRVPSRDNGLGLSTDIPMEVPFPSLASSSTMGNAEHAVASAISNTMGRTRYRSGSVGSQIAEGVTSIGQAALGQQYNQQQSSRTRYNRSYTTSRVDPPLTAGVIGEQGPLFSLTESNETPSNPPSPGQSKGHVPGPNLGVELYRHDANDRYGSHNTTLGYAENKGLLTSSSSIPSTEDGSRLNELLVTPTTGSSSGGILTALWAAGKGLGRAAGLLPPPFMEMQETYQNGGGFYHGKRRSSSWRAFGNVRRASASDGEESEKGLLGLAESDSEDGTATSIQRASSEAYFDLPKSDYSTSQSLPTPALSSKSLSNPDARHLYANSGAPGASQRAHNILSPAGLNRMKDRIIMGNSYDPVPANMPSPDAKAYRQGRPRGATLSNGSAGADLSPDTVKRNVAIKQVASEMGWTLGILGLVFVTSLGIVAAALVSLPIASLKSLPKKVSDLQILSAEIRSYMASSSAGWWHTVFVLTVTGMWKHSWSVPGAVVLNILVGSLLEPIPALLLLTFITSFGSLGAYSLSRPLAPLIALIFPKPLALVRSAINGGDQPTENIAMHDLTTRRSPSDSAAQPTIWRRLLVMRAMGLVPWSGMNVACGVVGVNPMTFLLTTAAGTASWSYVTASVGDILHQMAIPASTGVGMDGLPLADPNAMGGQSLSSLLRDPALVFKMVVLSLISLIPVLFKSRTSPTKIVPPLDMEGSDYPTASLLSSTIHARTPSTTSSPSLHTFVNLGNTVYRKASRLLSNSWKYSLAAAFRSSTDGYQALQTSSGDIRGGFPVQDAPRDHD